MDIYIVSTQPAVCEEYKKKDSSKKEGASVVISPLKIGGEDGNVKVTSGCNLWQSCYNSGCFFSIGSRQSTPKIKARGLTGP